jgi:hypothetical protein
METIEERLASFYLGQRYDLAEGKILGEAVKYDARDLTTHAVCVGMTGSGKTGLGVIVLEEAALDSIPSLVIDPKGDMTNLLLTFPDLRTEDFYPWVNPDDARRKDMDLETYAASTASLWRKGLEGTGQGPERIRRLKEAADFVIYTPGSSAGRQVSILHTLKAPTELWELDPELFREKIESVVSALLGLIGIQADPVRSREHILLANIFERAWRAGQDLDLAQLILQVQNPPFNQLGVFPIDTFYPERERMKLAMLLNGLVASPTFADWLHGEPLDIESLLHGSAGKPQVSILYIAHLSEPERQFFVTLLLEQVISWMRAQSGTTSLRALLYMDEMFGYLPPHPGNPPTKKPLLTLLKQARAFGLGLVLATQNPVDLDYKALSNAGTWFIGRMQTDQDKRRLLDGLEGVQADQGGTSRAQFDRLISALQSRVFLLHNVHQEQPVVFHTRWAMSFLRGPMTRTQIQQLVGGQASSPASIAAPPAVAARPVAPPPAAEPQQPEVPYSQVPPQLPSRVQQVFVSARVSLEEALARLAAQGRWSIRSTRDLQGYLVYEPALLGMASLRFPHTKSRQTHSAEVAYLVPAERRLGTVDWSRGRLELDSRDLRERPETGTFFAELPSELGDASRHTVLRKEFEDYVYYNSTARLWYNPHVNLYSEFGESEKAFQRRCREAAEDAHKAEVARVKEKHQRDLKRLEDRLEREQSKLQAAEATHSARKQEELLSGAETLFGVLTGRKRSSALSSASRKRRMTQQSRAGIEESERVIANLKREISDLKESERREVEEVASGWANRIDEVQEEEVRPRRTDIQVNLFALAWIPHWEVVVAGQALSLPAMERSES